jgi:hypothetical protein
MDIVKIKRTFMRSILCLLLSLSIFAPVAAHSSYPSVSLVYSPAFDNWCTGLTNESVNDAAISDLESKLSSFQDSWRKNAAQLLPATIAVTHKSFRFDDAQAALIFCGFPSMQLPFMINMRAFIAPTAGGDISSMDVFSNTVFQMLLARYVDDIFGASSHRSTPLLEKYKSEPVQVLWHLHIYAIEEMVYRKLGKESDLKAVVHHENLLRSAKLLSRAREIVKNEGAEKFVRELREAR